MRYGIRLAGSISLAIFLVFCCCMLFAFSKPYGMSAKAEQKMIAGSISSNPMSVATGATITVSGSGWTEPDGEPVSLGYVQVSLGHMNVSYCLIVSGAQVSSFTNGAFSGSLQFPSGTPPGIYRICATFGTTTAFANTFTILTPSSPQISIAFSKPPPTRWATVSGSNYYPAGTTVHLFWETANGKIMFTIPSAVSNRSGQISSTFRIRASITSGSYKIAATVSNQPALTSSITFSYNALTPTPIPSPTTTPSPTPVTTPKPSPTLASTPVATTPVATPIATQTIGATTPPGSTNNHKTASTDISSNNASMPIVLIGATSAVTAMLAAMLIFVLYFRRKKAHALHIAAKVGPTQNSPLTWKHFQTNDMPFPKQNGSMPAQLAWHESSEPTPEQLQMSPYVHLLQQPEASQTQPNSEPYRFTPDDPHFESMKQRVQMGLFVTPGMRRDG